jgi:acetyl esterase/lipase
MSSPRRSLSVVLSLLALLVCLPGRSSAQTCQTLSGLAYGTYVDKAGSTQSLLLDLMVPPGASASAPVPLVIWIHGGGWKSGSRTPIPARVSALCSRGYAVASLDYRLTAAGLWPAQIQDCKGAVRWLRAQASTYGLDPNRFGAWGESAGGHLAAMLGTSGDVSTVRIGNDAEDLEGATGGNLGVSSRVQAVVDTYGATDFLKMRFFPSQLDHDAATSDESRFLGGAIQTLPERAATANPISYITADDPPFLIEHGTVDKLIPFHQSQLLADALRAAGRTVTFVPVANAGHGGSLFDKPAATQPIYDFFDAVLRAPAAPVKAAATVRPVSDGLATAGLPAVHLQASDASATEAGANGGTILAVRDGDLSAPLTVSYSVAGTATAGSDYAALPGTVTIPAGQASAAIAVSPLNDAEPESAETVIVSVAGSASYAAGSPDQASVAIVDDDFSLARPIVSITLPGPDAAEPAVTGQLFLWRTGATTDPLTAGIDAGGTAQEAVDYTALPANVTFAAGIDRIALPVTPIDDYVTEPRETVTVTVRADSGAASPYSQGTVGLNDDDVTGTAELASIALSPTSVLGTGKATGTVTLDRAAVSGTSGGAPVDLSSSSSSAVVPASVTVPAGATTATFTITTSAVASDKAVQISASRRGITKTATLTVQAPAVSALTLSPSSFAGACQTSTGKVTLNAKAPAGGLVIQLANTDPAATVPATVTVPAGATSAGFPVSGVAVTSAQGGTVTASYGTSSRSAAVTVRPVGVLSLTLSPDPATGGTDVAGGVTLECAAAPGGVTVALSSSSASVATASPASLTIPAGASQGSFTVHTSTVTATASATIKAAANGVSKSLKLTVQP